MPITDLETLLLPVVEIGDLGKEHVKDMYYTKKGDTRLALYPVLSLRKSFQEMYAGDSEYVRRIFYLASRLNQDIIVNHANKILPLREVKAYFENESKQKVNTNLW